MRRSQLIKVLSNRGYSQQDHECKWQRANLIIEIFPDWYKRSEDRETLSLVMLERLGSTPHVFEKGGLGLKTLIYRFWLYEDAVPNVDILHEILGNIEHKFLAREMES